MRNYLKDRRNKFSTVLQPWLSSSFIGNFSHNRISGEGRKERQLKTFIRFNACKNESQFYLDVFILHHIRAENELRLPRIFLIFPLFTAHDLLFYFVASPTNFAIALYARLISFTLLYRSISITKWKIYSWNSTLHSTILLRFVSRALFSFHSKSALCGLGSLLQALTWFYFKTIEQLGWLWLLWWWISLRHSSWWLRQWWWRCRWDKQLLKDVVVQT